MRSRRLLARQVQESFCRKAVALPYEWRKSQELITVPWNTRNWKISSPIPPICLTADKLKFREEDPLVLAADWILKEQDIKTEDYYWFSNLIALQPAFLSVWKNRINGIRRFELWSEPVTVSMSLWQSVRVGVCDIRLRQFYSIRISMPGYIYVI